MDPAVTGCWGALQRILTGHSDSLVAAVDHRRNCRPNQRTVTVQEPERP